MTTDPPDPIAAAAARYKRDNEKAKTSRKELAALVLEALRDPKAEPVDIARRAEWTPAYVRKLARDNHIEADPSYKARTEKARARLLAEAAASPAVAGPRPQVTQTIPENPERLDLTGIFPEVAALPYGRIQELAKTAEDRQPKWVEEIRQEYPGTEERRLHYLIVNVGYRQGRRPPELAAESRPRLRADRKVTAEEAAGFAALARSKANDMQLKKLDQEAEKASGENKAFAVMHAALDMELLTHDEVYGGAPVRPAGSEETSG
ncbi:hypothetical protein [Streptomyces turgidiscabies]|uniref:hypothetical protein n=1 Tax=Streptomyces turgidiscabies TaxID=85558 RepID=UPI0038F6BF4E